MPSKPQYIYLDMNKWIDLARAYHGRADGTQFQDVLKCAQGAVARGDAVFPVADVHLLEARRGTNIDRQRRLLTVMWELSDGWAIAPTKLQVRWQFEEAVAKSFKCPPKPSKNTFGRGPTFAYGEVETLLAMTEGDEKRAKDIQEFYTTKAGMEKLLEIHGTAGGHAANQIFQSKLDANAAKNDTYRNVGINLQKDAQVERLTAHPTLVEVLSDFGLNIDNFAAKNLDERTQFFADVPMLDVEIELFDESARNQGRTTKPNDITDVTFLSATIPTCDIVVGERYWIDIAIRRDLNNKYGTVLLKDINDLKPYLCI